MNNFFRSIAGPALGGVLTEHFSFEISSTVKDFSFLIQNSKILHLNYTIFILYFYYYSSFVNS